jgi:hypothetical protein
MIRNLAQGLLLRRTCHSRPVSSTPAATLVNYVGRQPHAERERIIYGQHQRARMLGDVYIDHDIAVFGADGERARDA